jgi:uncharacterized protein YneF (UPF0154 family)
MIYLISTDKSIKDEGGFLMSGKRAVIYIVIAIVLGIALGGISRLTGVDLDAYVVIGLPLLFIAVFSGGDYFISKKKKSAEKSESND